MGISYLVNFKPLFKLVGFVGIFWVIFLYESYPYTIPIFVDYCIFNRNEKENVVEIYYGFLDNQLSYHKQGKKFVAELSMEIKFFANDTLYDSYNWTVYYEKDKIDTTNELQNLLVGQKNFVIDKNSKIKFQLDCFDIRDSSNYYRRTFEVENLLFPPNECSISDIQFAQFFEHSDTTNFFWQKEFLKGKFYVIPNPTLEVVGTNPRLYSYFEYYLGSNISIKQVRIEYRIFNNLKEEVLFTFKNAKVAGKSQFDINGFALDALSSGVYFFEVTLLDANGKFLTRSKKKKFYLLNPELPPEPVRRYTEPELFEKSIFATLSDKEADLEFEKAKYIASDYEKELFKSLTTTEAKRRFLFQFWRRRNPDTTLIYNQAYENFVQKVNYANKFFSVGNQVEGWKTDRGRVLIQYGEPTSREFYPREPNKRSYEIWFYSELQGGAFFYFVDLVGNGNFILVHSTAMNEIYNENWYTDFVTGTNSERIQKMFLNR
ncbi:MAG: GWxTD domain-containing protein [Ignavibacteria bacterium]|nr:GWxTD domain-containing protein [Ignavibacteria bacterium]